MITSSNQLLLAIGSALSVYSIARNTDLGDGGCVVRHIGHGNGKDRIQARLSIPRRRARGYGVGVIKCGVVGHRSINVKPNTNQQD